LVIIGVRSVNSWLNFNESALASKEIAQQLDFSGFNGIKDRYFYAFIEEHDYGCSPGILEGFNPSSDSSFMSPPFLLSRYQVITLNHCHIIDSKL
jgi:hypothetical protein